MTIEEEFFKTFGIKKNKLSAFCSEYIGHCIGCKYFKNSQRECYEYPQITDRILLELICLINKYAGSYSINSHNLDNLQSAIIHYCIALRNHKTFKQQVRSLFEVEE